MSHSPSSPPPRFLGVSRPLILILVCLTLFAGSVALYLGSVAFGFVGYDDSTVLLGHPNLYAQDSLWAALREIFVGYFPREEPLLVRDLSWLFDARIFGFTDPRGYHLGNVLLNAVDVVLLFLLLLHATRSALLAAFTAALFATLAIHVEPVCWIMGRKDLLSAFFVLLALLAQSIQLRQSSGRWRWILAAIVFLLYPLAVLSKFSAIVLVLVLAAHRMLSPYLDGQRAPAQPFPVSEWPRSLVGLIPHALVGVGIHFWYQRILSAFQILGHGPSARTFTHLKNLAVLIPLSLETSLAHIFSASEHSISYLRPNVAIRPTSGELVLAFATLTGLLALVVVLLRYRRDLAFYPIAFLLFMLPYFNVTYIGIWAADRYAYLASFCVAALIAVPVVSGLRSPRILFRRLGLAGFAMVGLLGSYQIAAGHRHQAAFRDREALWTYEKNLPHPSILAFESYAKAMLLKAQAAPDHSPLRRQYLESAVATAREGVQYYRSIAWKPTPGYVGRERIQLASLFSVLGLATELGGGSLEQQLELCRAAFQIAPADYPTATLASVLLAIAKREPRDLKMAHESLRHFHDHVRYASRDRLQVASLRAQLRRVFCLVSSAFRRSRRHRAGEFALAAPIRGQQNLGSRPSNDVVGTSPHARLQQESPQEESIGQCREHVRRAPRYRSACQGDCGAAP